MMRSKDVLPQSSGTQEEVAKDIAHLYSWANTQDSHYRDFSRQRREQRVQAVRPAVATEATIDPKPALPNVPKLALAEPAVIAPPAANSLPANPLPIRQVPVPQPIPPPADGLPIAQWFARKPANAKRQPREDTSGFQSGVAAIYSLAGGVGKSTLAANLAGALCSHGEETLLVDASGLSLLPFFFGAAEFKTGIRTFLAPGADQLPVHVYCMEDENAGWIETDVKPAMRASQRTIFDVGSLPEDVLGEIFGMCAVILVPLLPDLNSVLTIRKIESGMASRRKRGIAVPSVYYMFNEFDGTREIDQQAHEIASQQCGDRLLSQSICFGSETTEALAARMTATDLAPASDVARDYREIAKWLRGVAPARRLSAPAARWSER